MRLGVVNSWAGVEGPDKPIRVRVRWTAAQPIGRELAYRLELIDENGTAVISQTDQITPTTSSWQPGTHRDGRLSTDAAAAPCRSDSIVYN